MANPYKGELAIEADGKVYTLAIGSNALVALEGLFSTSDKRVTFQEVIQHANRNSYTHIRGILWALLRKHHRDMTLEQVGDLIDEVGLDVLDAKFANVLQQAVPDPKDLQALGVESNPPKAQARKTAGTGGRSARKRGGSA